MALIQCPDCDKDVSSNAPSCPNCGAPIADNSESSHKKGYRPYSDREVAVLLSKKKRTSHLLHLVLSILTVGLWIIIWLIVALSNNMENSAIDRKIQKGEKV